MIAGDLEGLADLGDADQPLVDLDGQKHKHAPRTVGVFRDVHRYSFQPVSIRLAKGPEQKPDGS
jgi:hypothetical protein